MTINTPGMRSGKTRKRERSGCSGSGRRRNHKDAERPARAGRLHCRLHR
jgi:hypothetical protein